MPSCGTVWNTFWTRGVCPGCGYKWQKTQCLACGFLSPHEAWYHYPPEREQEESERIHEHTGAAPNPSFHLTCYGWLRQPSRAGELKR